MNTKQTALLAMCLSAAVSALAQGSAFTYQGRLNDGAGPANGSYDLAFTLFATNTGGGTIAGPVTNSATAVSNGLFTTTIDFGAGAFTGGSDWLEIAVSTNGANTFTTLAPRQQLTPTPYALYSANAASAATATTAASAGSVLAANIVGTIPVTQLPPSVLTNGESGVNLSGSFTGNGSGLTSLNAANLTGTLPVAELPAAVVTNGASGVNLSGTFTGNGAGVTNVDVGTLQHRIGFVVAWGYNSSGQTTVPAGLSKAVAIAAGAFHSLTLSSDGTVAGWGDNTYGQLNIPTGLNNAVAIAGGYYYSLVLKSDGTVAAWGQNNHGQTTIPVGLSNVVAIAGGTYFSLALKSDGTVAAWGDNSSGQTTVPAGLSNVVAIAAGGYHDLALKSDGTVVAWGWNGYSQLNIPVGLSNVVAIAAGQLYSLALKGDGTVAVWGDSNSGETAIPAGLSNVVAIAGGGSHCLALKSDGTVAAWGYNNSGQATIPAGLSNVVAIAGGAYHSLALRQQWIPAQAALLTGNNVFQGTVQATDFVGPGTIPVGGIIMWSGVSVPSGWALCDGSNGTPDLRGRFVLASGAGSGLTPRTLGQLGGAETHALTISEIPAHNHSAGVNTVGYGSSYSSASEATAAPGNSHNNGTQAFTTGSAGGGAAFDKMPPYYVLAFVMRVQ